jgi:hypothetical protein
MVGDHLQFHVLITNQVLLFPRLVSPNTSKNHIIRISKIKTTIDRRLLTNTFTKSNKKRLITDMEKVDVQTVEKHYQKIYEDLI